MCYLLLRKLLFCLDPEVAHAITLNALRMAHQVGLTRFFKKHSAPRQVMGLTFPNPIGLAAGLDKNGDYIDALTALGFGFVEIGTVTPKPQEGNPKPRLFRLTEQEALINRMGFNNKGLEYVVERLKNTKYKGILGINIGKNRDTSIENAVDDYVLCFRRVAPYASYITINISSPNTLHLRELQLGDALKKLLSTLKKEQAQQEKYIPLVVKIAPDLSSEELKKMADIFLAEKIDGVIATNTTAVEEGGLSGKPLTFRSTQIIRELFPLLNNQIPIIASGGVMTVEDAIEKMNAGASLIQVYTGLIYQGPNLLSKFTNISNM